LAIVTWFAFADAIMTKPIDELIIQSILDDFAAGHQSREELEAKALFRLLNYCPPEFESALGNLQSQTDATRIRKTK
jgi:hypothetical protein